MRAGYDGEEEGGWSFWCVCFGGGFWVQVWVVVKLVGAVDHVFEYSTGHAVVLHYGEVLDVEESN